MGFPPFVSHQKIPRTSHFLRSKYVGLLLELKTPGFTLPSNGGILGVSGDCWMVGLSVILKAFIHLHFLHHPIKI